MGKRLLIALLFCMGLRLFAADPKEGALGEEMRSLINKGNMSIALDKLNSILNSDAHNVEARYYSAFIFYTIERYSDATREINALLQDDPRNLDALSLASNIALARKDFVNAKSYIDTAVKLSVNNTNVLGSLANYYLSQRNYTQAANLYRSIIKADPNNAEAYHGLGLVLYRNEREQEVYGDGEGVPQFTKGATNKHVVIFQEAEEAYNKALELNPNLTRAYVDRSRIRYYRGRFADALDDLNRAIASNPLVSYVYLERGNMYFKFHKDEEAIADLSKAINIDTNLLSAYVLRASLYERGGQNTQALADYEAILAIDPTVYFAYEPIALLSYKMGFCDKAAFYFPKALNFQIDTSRYDRRFYVHYEYALLGYIAAQRSGQDLQASADYLRKIYGQMDRKFYLHQAQLIRLYAEKSDNTLDIERDLATEKNLYLQNLTQFYLAEYWFTRGRAELARKYLALIPEMKGPGLSLELELAAQELARTGKAPASSTVSALQ